MLPKGSKGNGRGRGFAARRVLGKQEVSHITSNLLFLNVAVRVLSATEAHHEVAERRSSIEMRSTFMMAG